MKSAKPESVKRPHRGSAARGQSRDGRGRFRPVAADNRDTTVARPRECIGPSYLKRMVKLDLVRMLVRLDQWHARLTAEAEMRPWSPDAPAAPSNLASARGRETAVTQLRRDHLQDVMLDFAAAATDPTPTQLAAEMRRRLGSFQVQQLYRPSLIDLWRPDQDFFGKRKEDRVPGAMERMRLSRQQLVRSIVSTKRRIAILDAEIDERLMSEAGFDD